MKIKNYAVVLMILCFITGCAFNSMVAVYDNNERIASDSNTYNLSGVQQTSEDNHFTASVEKMEGMDTIWSFDAEEDMTIDITYTIDVTSGIMKLVWINPDKECLTVMECDSEMIEPAQSSLDIKSGNNRMKIVAGKDTKFTIDITISEGDLKKLG